MKKRLKWLALLAIFSILSLGALGCSEGEVLFEDTTPDGYDDVDLVTFEATSSTGGNPGCAVVIAFAPTGVDDISEWQGSQLTFNKVELATEDESLVASFIRDDFTVDLAAERPTAASLGPQAGIAWRAMSLLREGAEVTLKLVHGDQSGEVTMPLGLLLNLATDETPWESGKTYGYLLALPMTTLLEEMLAAEPDIGMLAAAMTLHDDSNRNGRLDDGEGEVGEVSDPGTPSDGDEPATCETPEDCPAPIPTLAVPADQVLPEPLSVIHLDGRNSTSPFGESRKPFQYYWEWVGRPDFAIDAVLIGSTDTFDNPRSIMGKWTTEGFPKIYFPIAGTYKIRMKVKDATGVESGPSEACPSCQEWAQIDIKVKPSQKLHVELVWDRGDNVDMDLFLVRYRTDGTLGVPEAMRDKASIPGINMGNCSDLADCYDGAFECVSNVCVNECATDADCEVVSKGWYCDAVVHQCKQNPDGIITCETDADCDEGTTCNPASIGLQGFKMICTKHDGLVLNDTCTYINKSPRWGEYSDTQISCETNSSCIEQSEQYLCDTNSGQCVKNSLDDDPILNIDDVDGWGPENISVASPISGRYRVVVSLYADPNNMVTSDGPLGPVRAYVRVYINGELALNNDISHELVDVMTYWKAADIVWNAETGEGAFATVEPICAGWTLTECSTTDECAGWYGSDFTCARRDWGAFCSICESASGMPDECHPTDTPCSTNADCTGEADTCTEIKGNYCTCEGSNEFADSSNDPYANPFVNQAGAIFDPLSSSKRSIWCDDPNATQIDGIDILSGGAACSSLYFGN